MNEIISKLDKFGSYKIFLTALFFLVIIGIADYTTGQNYSFYIFYAIPVLIATWFAGRKYGIYLIIITVFFWAADNFYNRESLTITLDPYYEISVQTLFFILMIVIFSALKKSIEDKKNLELEKIQREMEIARQVQTNLYPRTKPEFAGLDYYGICFTADAVGGDYYDYIKLNENKAAFAIGDISGHGIGPALLMAGLVGFVRSNASQYADDIKKFVQYINENIFEVSEDSMFATFFYGLFDLQTGIFSYVNAGHNPPLHFKNKCGDFEMLDSADLLIGAVPDITYHQSSVEVESGDLLILYTDGVTETFSDKNEQFGAERLKEVIKNNSAADLEEIINTVKSELVTFSGNSPQADDVTLLIIRKM